MNGAHCRPAVRGSLVALIILSLLATAFVRPTTADIYRWDNGELITNRSAGPYEDFSGFDLSYADLDNTDMHHAIFRGGVLADARLRWAALGFADFYQAIVAGADLSEADLTGASLEEATVTDANFTGANLTDADFRHASVEGAVFVGAEIQGTSLIDITDTGFTAEQLYGTASYQSGNLQNVGLAANDMVGWDFAGKDLSGADLNWAHLTGADLSGANLTDASFDEAYLTNTNLVGANLTSAYLPEVRLTEADLTGANLTAAHFGWATMTNARLTGAVIRGAIFRATETGFTAGQLYSTTSYQSGDLRGIDLRRNNLSSWDFSGQNLTAARFENADLLDADFSLADLREATFSALPAERDAAILPDGTVQGLVLEGDETLRIWDYSGDLELPIVVQNGMDLAPDATLHTFFEDVDWGSTINFEPGIRVELNGTLELGFAPGARPSELAGTTFDLFDWDGITLTSTFAEIVTEAAAIWDTAKLYTTGEVTLLSAEIMLGDVNLDGEVNGLDVDPFVDVLLHGPYSAEADVNEDGVVNGLDVDPFVTAVVGGSAQQIPEPSTLLLTLLALGLLSHTRRRSAP